MPTYEYACDKCGHHFEKLQSILDEPLKRCPKCRSRIRRVMHGGAALVFKGSGFYTTDNRKGGSSRKSDEKLPCGGDKPCKKGGTCPAADD
jgi:putative FmdB family regulatory protein